MIDREKVKYSIERCISHVPDACRDCAYDAGHPYKCVEMMLKDALAMLKEQEKLVDVDALREKLGLAKDCAKCKQNTRACQYDSHFSLMDFCERFDMAIEELM